MKKENSLLSNAFSFFINQVFISLISKLSIISVLRCLIHVSYIPILIKVVEWRLWCIKVLYWLNIIIRLKRNVLIWSKGLVLIWVEYLGLVSVLRQRILVILMHITLLLIILSLVYLLLYFIVQLNIFILAILNFDILLILFFITLYFNFLLFPLTFILNKSMLR